jgi:predicted nucleic-acid-binding Zn-ribbon protein
MTNHDAEFSVAAGKRASQASDSPAAVTPCPRCGGSMQLAKRIDYGTAGERVRQTETRVVSACNTCPYTEVVAVGQPPVYKSSR